MASNAKPAYFGRVLQRGSDGPDVALVQRWLDGARARYPALPRVRVDGAYGADTAASVRAYQRLLALNPDGEVGSDTWDSLYATYSALNGSSDIWPGITVRQGDSGAVVRDAQIMLKTLVPGLTVDGRYGVDTRNAVFAWQVVHGLAPDGVLGKDTWESLFA